MSVFRLKLCAILQNLRVLRSMSVSIVCTGNLQMVIFANFDFETPISKEYSEFYAPVAKDRRLSLGSLA